VQDRLHQCRVD